MSQQEAQQAQTIGSIKRAHRLAKLKLSSQGVEPLGISAHLDRGALLKIVDSQAQKIAEQEKEIERLTLMCKQEDTQIVALVKQRDEARGVADDWRDKAGSKYDSHPWEKV